MTKNIREEIQYLLEQCEEHLSGKKRWEKHLSHIVKRTLDGRIRGDACTNWGAGGYSADLGFWWQIKWSDLSELIQQLIEEEKLSINVLELAAIVVNFFATALHFKENPTKGGWHPKVYCQGDNVPAVSWYNRFSNPEPRARRLTKILAMGQKYTDLDLDVTWMAGKQNHLADAVSRGSPADTLDPLFKQKVPTNTAALSSLQVPLSTKQIYLKNYQMSKEVKSWLCSALLLNDTTSLPLLNKSNLGHFTREQSITLNFAAPNWTWTLH